MKSGMNNGFDLMALYGRNTGCSDKDGECRIYHLNLLKDLDVDVIKLDKSFFTNINEDNDETSTDKIVVKNIVSMVNELHMEAISEGVETKYQADFLRDIKCKMAQGFMFDKPLPKEEFETRLADRDFFLNKG